MNQKTPSFFNSFIPSFFHSFLLLSFTFISLLNISFSGNSDSLIQNLKFKIQNTNDDTTKVNLLNNLGWELQYQNPDTSILLGKQALEIAIKNSYQKGIANSSSNLGVYYYFKGDYPLSLSYLFKALEIGKQLNNKKGIAVSLGNIGAIYHEQGNYPKALKHYFEALRINKELRFKAGMAVDLGNIGIVYAEQASAAKSRQNITGSDFLYTKALKHFFEVLEIGKELGDKNRIANQLGNIGLVYAGQARAAKFQKNIAMNDSLYAKALKYYFEALIISKELGNKNGIARHLGNIGIVYDEQAAAANSRQDFAMSDSLYARALEHYFKALVIDKELGNKNGIAIWLGNIGSLYTQAGRFKEAEAYLDSALAIDTVIGFLDHTRNTYLQLSHLYDTTARYQLAYHHYKKYRTAKDSLFNEEKSKDIGRLEQNHEFEMEELKNEKMEEEVRRRESEVRSRRNMLQYSGILLTLIFLFMGIFLLARRFRKIKEHKLYEQYIKIVEAALFVSFLILFEFILVLLDPYLEEITGGEPVLKLLANAVIAGVIFPLHKILEAKLKASVIKTERGKWLGETRKQEGGGSKTLLLIVGFTLISLFNNSFSDKTDSLKTALANAKEDTAKVKLLIDLGRELMYQNPDTSILLGKQALKIAIKNDYKKGVATSNSDLGLCYCLKGDYALSLSSHFKTLEIQKQLNNNTKDIAASLCNIGIVYHEQGNYPKALKHYFEALVIDKELGNKKGIAAKLGNIGIVYQEQAVAANSRQDIAGSDSLYTKALKHYFEAMEIEKELGNKSHMAANIGNIGIVYKEQASAAKSRQDIVESDSLYAKALKHYFEALVIDKELGNKNGIAIHLGNIGIVYKKQASAAKSRQDIASSDSLYTKALKHYFEALEIDKELGNKNGIARHLGNIGSLYIQTGLFKVAKVRLDSALAISDLIGSLALQKDHHEMFSHLYDTTARYQLAYHHYKKYSVAKDSLFNEEKSKEIGRLEQMHQFEIEELEREQKEAEQARVAAEIKERKNNLQYSGILIGMFLLFGILFFIVRISLPEWMIELSAFVPFMFLFEFILMLLEPYVENFTGGEPAFKLLINALCAAIIFPIHGFFEKKLKARIYKIKKEKEEKYAEEFRKEAEEYSER